MGQAKRRQHIIQRVKRLEEQRQFLEEIKRSHLKKSTRKIESVSERFDWLEIPKRHTPPMQSSVMYKVKNFKSTNHRRQT
jgi:hypothetical protein